MIPAHLRVEPTKALADKCLLCEDWLVEARERMTDGGIPVISLIGGYVVQIGGRTPQWVARAAR